MVTGNNGNVYDALRSIPEITVRSDGEIELNGTSKLTVYLDNRKFILQGTELLNYLKSTPVSNIAKIEISYVTGARADGQDSPTILNLTRKREKSSGYSAGINMDGQIYKARQFYGAAYGQYNTISHSINGSYSTYFAHNPSELLTNRPYLKSDERLTQKYHRLRKDRMHHAELTYDYHPTSRLSAGTALHYNYFNRKEPAVMETSVPLNDAPTITRNNALFRTSNIYGEVYVRRSSDSKESDWTAACDFFSHKSTERQFMEDNRLETVKGNMTGTTFGIVASFEFNKAISHHWSLSSGARCSYVGLTSSGIYSSTDGEIGGLGSSFAYKENVNALYLETKTSYGPIRATAGLRAEQSNHSNRFSGNESAAQSSVFTHYIHFYPSMSVMLNAAGSWSLSYTARVKRPGFSDLDPFIHIFDDITHVGGNINLKESTNHSLNLAWSDNSRIRIALSAEYTADEMVKCYRELTDKIVYVCPENLPRHITVGLSASTTDISIMSAWHLSASGNLIYSRYSFPESMSLSPNVLLSPLLDLTNIVSLPAGITAELKLSYRAPIVYGQVKTSSLFLSNLSIGKRLLNNRLALSLYVNDIFNTNHTKSTIYLNGREAYLYEKEFEDMRKAGLSVAFTFSGGTKASHDTRDTWIDELNRVNL